MSKAYVNIKGVRLKHFLKKCWLYIGVLIVTMAIVFCVFRALTPWARQYKTVVEQYLSTWLGQPVTIQNMETSWYWFEPVLRLDQVSLTDDKDNNLKLNKLLIGINILSSLWHWQLQPGILYIDRTRLILRQNETGWAVEGLSLGNQDLKLGEDAYLPILAWLSAQDKIMIRHLSLVAYLNTGKTIKLRHVNLTVQQRGGQYHVKGRAEVVQSTPTEFSIAADIQLDAKKLNQTKGRVYLSVHSFLPAQWQDFFPKLPVKVDSGSGYATLWLDLQKGSLSSLQSQFHFSHLTIRREGDSESQLIDSLGVNLGFRVTKEGWELNGNHVVLQMNNVTWPENVFFIHHNTAQQAYRIFVKQLLLKPLRAIDVPWPDALKPLLAMKPEGELHDVEFNVKEKKQLDYLLAGFSNLGWVGREKIPTVSGLTGILFWQPTEGRLELDSHGTMIKPTKLPSVLFSQINLAAQWKILNQGMNLSVEHFILQNPELTLTAKGSVKKPENASSSHVHFESKFSANQAEQWIKYIPSEYLKPKLNQWLNEDIKKITKASGQIMLDGLAADFPFDRSPGAFSISTTLKGVDLYITSKWPLTRDIDAHLTVDKRNMNVDIQHADFKGIIVDNLNLRMDDLGMGYDTLLIHGKMNALAPKIMSYVSDSPLKTHLSRLSALNLKGLLGLDINIEVPFYPESNTILTRGEVALDNNKISIKQGVAVIDIDQLKGVVAFDENGVKNSQITGMLAASPLAIHLQSIQKPKSAIVITLDLNTSMNALNDTFHFPFMTMMKGPLNIAGVMTLPNNDNEVNRLNLHSSLNDVQIDLPAPLKKSSGVEAPLTANIEFNADKIKQVKLTYTDPTAGVNLKVTQADNKDWLINLNQKDISADLRYQPATRLLSGEIARFHISPLNDKAKQQLLSSENLTPQSIPNLHVSIKNFLYGDIELGQVDIESKSSKTLWAMESLKVTSPSYVLSMKGKWAQQSSKNHTDIEGNLSISNLGESLKRLHAKSLVEANKGLILFEGGWQGGVTNFALGKVDGQMQVSFNDGRLPDLGSSTEEKLGIGKVLSILSLQTIPRRLKLDFSDLSQKGYSFDKFKGGFQVKQGVMHTEDSYIDGPVAYVSMKGDLDVVKQRYDLNLHVSPHVMASLPVVATIAGGPIGPIAGIATWLALKIIDQGIYKVTGYTYKVTGPWSNPDIQQVSINKKRLVVPQT